MVRIAFLLLLSALAAGCVYPRRATSLTPVTRSDAGSIGAPAGIWQVTVVEAQVPSRKRGDLPWDEGGGAPDVFARIYRGEELLFETPTINDTLTPRWNVALPRNVRATRADALRFELWDRDVIGSDPIGQMRSQGLPSNAAPEADARLLLEGGSYLTIRVSAPRPHRGVGLSEYEVQPDALVVLAVVPHSPAERAGIEPGEAIVAIGERRVSEMNPAEASSALSMASQRSTQITLRSVSGRERAVELDRGFVWLTM